MALLAIKANKTEKKYDSILRSKIDINNDNKNLTNCHKETSMTLLATIEMPTITSGKT